MNSKKMIKSTKSGLIAGTTLILAMMLLAHTAVVALDNTVKCQSLSGVDDETGAYLTEGDFIQIICTGTDGTIDQPDSNGNPTDNDWLVDTTYAGCGFPFEPNAGKFDKTIDTSNLNIGDIIYCRAWNDATIAGSTHYGDSGTYTVTGAETEIHDFGTWSTVAEKSTPSPTASPSPSPTPTSTPVPTPTASPSPAQTETPISGEPTPSPAPSLSPSPSQTLTPTASTAPISSPTLAPAKSTPSLQTPTPTATSTPTPAVTSVDVKVLIVCLAISIVIARRKRKRYKT